MQKIEKHGRQLVWDKLGLKLSVLAPRSNNALYFCCTYTVFPALQYSTVKLSVLAPRSDNVQYFCCICTVFPALQYSNVKLSVLAPRSDNVLYFCCICTVFPVLQYSTVKLRVLGPQLNSTEFILGCTALYCTSNAYTSCTMRQMHCSLQIWLNSGNSKLLTCSLFLFDLLNTVQLSFSMFKGKGGQ